MRKIIMFFAAFLILALCMSAYAEPAVVSLIGTAERLAYATDNVTITGSAEFSLNGERFKTADIIYVQEGENSFWQEKLLTPREGKPDLASGFTVIQNGNSIYRIDVLEPDRYYPGADAEQSNLLRRTARSDFLFSLAKTVAEQLEPWFSSFLTVTELENGGTEFRADLKYGDSPALLDHLVLLSMRFLGKRLLGIDDDREGVPGFRYDWITYPPKTEIQKILVATRTLAMNNSSVRLSLDEEDRLTEAMGYLSARLTDDSGKIIILGIQFQLNLSDYGTSLVKPYQESILTPLLSAAELENMAWQEEEKERTAALREAALAEAAREETWTRLEEKAEQICQAAGYQFVRIDRLDEEDGRYDLVAEVQKGQVYMILTEDGRVQYFHQTHGEWFTTDEPAEAPEGPEKEKILDFVRAMDPELPVPGFQAYCQFRHDDNWLVELIGTDTEGKPNDLYLTVRFLPEWRIEFFTSIGMTDYPER